MRLVRFPAAPREDAGQGHKLWPVFFCVKRFLRGGTARTAGRIRNFVSATGRSSKGSTAYPLRTQEWLGPGIGGGSMTATTACRTCGTEHLEHARFCHGCGLPVKERETRAEYKQVTVLFADVVHSMDIAAAVGAERWREIMAELADRSRGGGAALRQHVRTVDRRWDHGGVRCAGGVGGPRRSGLSGGLGRSGAGDGLAVDVRERDGIELWLRVGLNSGRGDRG